MDRNSLKIALILSLAFNVAVIAAFAYGYVRRSAPEGFGPHFGGPRSDMLGRRCSHLARQIGIPAERAERFSHMMADSSGGMRDLRAHLQKSRCELVELIGAREPDEKAIMAKVDEISIIQGQLEKRLIQRTLGISSTLNPEERKRFMRMIRVTCGPFDRGIPKRPETDRKESEVGK
jgi:Spy/CpxP family protein refolding chaperone